MKASLDLNVGIGQNVGCLLSPAASRRARSCNSTHLPFFSSVTPSRVSVARASAEERIINSGTFRKAEQRTAEVRYLQQMVSSLQQKGSLQEKVWCLSPPKSYPKLSSCAVLQSHDWLSIAQECMQIQNQLVTTFPFLLLCLSHAIFWLAAIFAIEE